MLKLISFYKFVKILNPIDYKLIFKKFLIDNKLKGSIIFSLEGINGSISGKQSNIDLLIKFLKEKFLFKEFDTVNECEVDFVPFKRAKPSLLDKLTCFNFSFLSTVEPDVRFPLKLTSPIPMSGKHKCARGDKSPDAPSEPCSYTIGIALEL